MSVIAQKVAAEHRQTSHRDRRLACSCTWVADRYRDSDLGPFAQWARLIATVTEAAVRDQIAAVWDQGYTSGHSNAMRQMSDEPNVPTTPNPHRGGAR